MIGMTVVIAMIGCGSLYCETQSELRGAIAKRDSVEARLNELRVKTGRLESELERLKKDPSFVAALARGLGLVRAGEVVVRVEQSEFNRPSYELTSDREARMSQGTTQWTSSMSGGLRSSSRVMDASAMEPAEPSTRSMLRNGTNRRLTPASTASYIAISP